jgi:hypothetical protein
MIQVINGLSNKELSKEGYKKLVSLIKQFVYKYRWPKIILDENNEKNKEWTDEDILSLTHQFILYLFESNKLKNINKIPDNYLNYYFHQIVVTYVSDKIHKSQSINGISFQTIKRIVNEILITDYKEVEIDSKRYWKSKESCTENLNLSQNKIINLVECLPKITIDPKTKHFKKYIKNAVSNIYSTIESEIEEKLLIQLTYNLFDQSYLTPSIAKEDEVNEIDIDELTISISKIFNELVIEDIPLIVKYYFEESNYSLEDLAKENDLPKSTLHYRIIRFRNLLNKYFTPKNDDEGIIFLEKLFEKLDEVG